MIRPGVLLLIGLAGSGGLSAQAGPGPAPQDIPALHRRAGQLAEARDFAAAREAFERLAGANPADGRYWLGLANAEAALGHDRPAIAAYQRALALGFGSRPERSYRIARLYAHLGQRDSMLVWLRAALTARFERRPEIGRDSAFLAFADDPEFRRLAGLLPAGPLTRDEGWRFDLALFAEEARRFATGPHPVALTPAFDSAVAELAARVGTVSDAYMYVEIQRLMTLLGNGHSVLFPFPTPRVTLTMLPVDFYRFSDGLFVVGGQSAGAGLVGSRVERIGGLSSDSALERVSGLVTRDNPMGVTWNGPYFLAYPTLLHALDIESEGDSNSAGLVVRSPDGAVRRVRLGGTDLREPAKLMPPGSSTAPPPLYLRHPDDTFWMEPLPADSACYVQINQIADQEKVSLAAFADTILARSRRSRLTTLILDLRRNNGGHGNLLGPLVRALVRFEGRGPRHRIVVIMGRNTFSAAQNLLNQIEQHTDAVFVGEPSSSRPNFVGEDTEILLPFSGLAGSISSRYFQDSDPLDDRLWIPPDVPVTLSSGDYFANRDPVLVAALAYIRLKAGP